MKKIIFGSVVLATITSPSQAQTSLENLPDVVVTATRADIEKKQLSKATTVYTRKDIERLQVKTLPELLTGTPGIDVTQQGGYGKTSSVFMRGTNADHVLVLVDGIKVGSATLGTTPFEFVPIDQVERVEIIRGPQSSLYGSEALGGVIQIFTRKGDGKDKPHVTLDAGAGSYDTYRASGTVNGSWKGTWYNLSSSQFGSQGFNSQQPSLYTNQPDRDGYLNTSLNARLGHKFENNAELETFFLRSEGKTEYDGFYNKTDFVNQVVGISGAADLLKNWRSTLRLGQSRDDNDNFLSGNGQFASNYNSTRWNASWTNQLSFDEHQVVFGADYRLDQVDSTEKFQQTSRYDVGAFTELHSQLFTDHFINASLRWDKNEAFGDYVTGSFGWRYNWAHGISLLANFGNAFKAPSFNNLYFPNYGNPNLKPEESTSFETGLAGNHDWGQWQIRAYHTDIDNLITPVLIDPATFTYQAQNIGKSQIDGIETEIGTQVLGFNTKLSMNMLSPRNRETNHRLPRRADKTLSFDVSRSISDVDLGVNVQAQDHRYDDPANRTKVGGYVTLDLRTAYHLDKHWSLSVKLNNALDNKYQLVNNYNTAGRNFFVSIHFTN